LSCATVAALPVAKKARSSSESRNSFPDAGRSVFWNVKGENSKGVSSMRWISVLPALAIAALAQGQATAQYGLYGAPELLPMVRPGAQDTAPALASVDPSVSGRLAVPPQPLLDGPISRSPVEVVEPLLGSPPPYTNPPARLSTPGLYGGQGCGQCGGDECVDCTTMCSPCECLWYAEAGGLIMGRNDANRVWTTYRTGVNAQQLLNTDDIDLDWMGGAEVRAGRSFCCGTWTAEVAFWGLAPEYGMTSFRNGQVSTPLIVSDIEFDNGVDPVANGVDLFDDVVEHRVWRENEFYNLELNVMRNQFYCAGPLDCDWGAGIRWFRFDESLGFDSLDTGDWGDDPLNEAYLRDEIENNLLGFQVGCNLGYAPWEHLRVFVSPTAGIYGNYIQNDFVVYRGDGTIATPTAASGMSGSYPVSSSETVVSFLTEIDLGMAWQFHPQWSVYGGYRLLYATGIGLADHQIPTYVVDIPEIEDINNNGDLVLHGAFAGLSFCF
jgi:hypothetical protein